MDKNITLRPEQGLINSDFMDMVDNLEKSLLCSDLPGVAKGNDGTFPLKHSFSDGIYVREMFMRKGGLVIGKMYKISHTWFLLSGELEIATSEGVNHYIAPCYVTAPVGAKRVLHALEDSVFVNVYPNPDNITDIETLENLLTWKSYEEFKEYKLLNE
jgi:hypothetical protein